MGVENSLLTSSIIRDKNNISMPYVIIFFLCYTIGVGILNIPFIVSKLGYITTIFVLGINFGINIYSFLLLAKLSNKVKIYDLIQLVEFYFSKQFSLIVKVSLICIYIVAETLHLIFAWFFFNFLLKNQFGIDTEISVKTDYLWRLIFCIGAFIIMFPLVIKKEISALKNFTYIFLGLLLYCILIFLFQGPSFHKHYNEENNNDVIPFGKVDYLYIDYFSTIFLSFSCHSNILLTWGKMKNPTLKRVKQTIYGGLFTELTVYILFGFISYFFYGSRIEEIGILRDPIDDNDYLMKFGIFAYGLGLVISNGFHSTILTNVIFEIFKFKENRKNRILVGLTPILISLFLTFIYPNIFNVLSIGGGVFCNFAFYLIPVIVHYHVNLKNNNKPFEKIFCILLILFLFFILFSNFAIKFI